MDKSTELTRTDYPAKQGKLLLYIVYILYFLYYIADMNSSANTLVKQTGTRTSVHLLLAALIAVFGIYCFFRRSFKLNDAFRTGLFMLALWGVLVDFLNSVSFWAIATHIGLIMLFFLTSYFGSNYLTDDTKRRMVVVIETLLFIITVFYAVMAYFNYRDYNGEKMASVLNMSYNILVFLPILLSIRVKWIKWLTVSVGVVYIIASLKRGAIVTLFAMLFVYYLYNRNPGKKKGILLNKLLFGLIALTSLVAVVIAVNSWMDGALFERFTPESLRFGSNRDTIYRMAFDEIISRDPLRLLLGTGSGSTSNVIGSGAHNELLEITFNYGLIGLAIYIATVVGGVLHIRKMRRRGTDNSMTCQYAMGLTYMVLVGLVGSSLFSHMSFHILLTMGMAANARKESV